MLYKNKQSDSKNKKQLPGLMSFKLNTLIYLLALWQNSIFLYIQIFYILNICNVSLSHEDNFFFVFMKWNSLDLPQQWFQTSALMSRGNRHHFLRGRVRKVGSSCLLIYAVNFSLRYCNQNPKSKSQSPECVTKK